MRVCLMIEGQENVTWAQWLDLARTADAHGFDALFRSDHYMSLGGRDTEGTLDAWTTLAALAAVTPRIRFGTLVSPVTFRHPAVLAKSVVTADHVSGGRVELGMGAGWHEGEHRAYGFPFPPVRERVTMLAEQVEIVHRLWDRDEPRVSFQGSHYALEDCNALPKPLQDPHPRLLLGGQGGPRVAALAARWADEYNTHGKTPDDSRRIRESLDRACESEGRDPATLPLSIMTGFAIGPSLDDAKEHATRVLGLRQPFVGSDPFAALGPGVLRGTPEMILEQLGALAEAGVTRVMLQHLVHADLEVVELLGREVIPQAEQREPVDQPVARMTVRRAAAPASRRRTVRQGSPGPGQWPGPPGSPRPVGRT
jgi:F420-dependent oxidoreductase-like protein